LEPVRATSPLSLLGCIARTAGEPQVAPPLRSRQRVITRVKRAPRVCVARGVLQLTPQQLRARHPQTAVPAYATIADAVLDSYFQLGGSFLARL
jgi:hypothetical protein